MKKSFIIYIAMAGLTLLSCARQEDRDPAAPGRALSLTASVGDFTKATDTAFEDGDVIGLFASGDLSLDNVPLFYSQGALVSQETIEWPSTTARAAFQAYFPYDSELFGNAFEEGLTLLPFYPQNYQADDDYYAASDLLLATASATAADAEIHLNFHHAMSKLIISIDNQIGFVPDYVEIENVYGLAAIDLAAGTAEAVTGNNIPEEWVAHEGGYVPSDEELRSFRFYARKIADNTYEVLIPAQTVKPTLRIYQANSGLEFTFEAEKDVRFVAGKRSTAHVTLAADASSIAFSAEIADWEAGDDFEAIVPSDDDLAGCSWSIRYWEYSDSGSGYQRIPLESQGKGIFSATATLPAYIDEIVVEAVLAPYLYTFAADSAVLGDNYDSGIDVLQNYTYLLRPTYGRNCIYLRTGENTADYTFTLNVADLTLQVEISNII